MHFGSRNNKFNYSVRGKQLEVVSMERDLLLEKVQSRFTRLFDDLRSKEYKDRLEVLKLWSLEEDVTDPI